MGTKYQVPEGARLRVLTTSGKITVTGEDRGDIEIDPPERRIDTVEDGRVLETRSKSASLDLKVPAGMNVSVGTISGSVRLCGKLGSVRVSTVSGKVEVENATGDADIRSISGSIDVDDCGGACRANTKSGSIELGHVAGAVNAHTMSGSIDVGTAGKDDVEVKTISGKVGVAVDPGRAPSLRFRSVAGKAKCDCEQGTDFEIRAASISGSIEVRER
jgi:DUF4097 and DUF4098 domain-containing protein YvlB